ncbi:MAG TPA: DUF3810 family protein [Vicinamibacterales bacterium]
MAKSATRAVALAAVAGVVALAPVPATAIDRWYSGWFFPTVQPVVTAALNVVPLAIFDAVLVASVMYVVWLLTMVARARPGTRVRRLGQSAVSALALCAVVYLWFAVLWGLNYRRTPLEARFVRTTAQAQSTAVTSLGTRAVARVNALHTRAHAEGWTQEEWQDAGLRSAFADTLQAIGHGPAVEPGRLKQSVIGPYFRWTGVDGMVSPFTLEVLANPDLLPFERPFIAAHEWSHLAGYADEAEASFVGWVTCVRAGIAAQYSGWLFLLWQVRGEVPAAERQAIDMALDAGPRADMAAVVARLRRGASPQLRRVSWAAYDQYLKANRVDEGVRSYSRVLELLATARFDDDWVPEIKAQSRRQKAEGSRQKAQE